MNRQAGRWMGAGLAAACLAAGCVSWRPTVREARFIVHDTLTRLQYARNAEVIKDKGLIVDSTFQVGDERFRYDLLQYELARDTRIEVAGSATSFRKGKLKREEHIDIPWHALRAVTVKENRMNTGGYIGYFVTFTYRTKNDYGDKGEEAFTIGEMIPDVNVRRDTVHNLVLALKVLCGQLSPGQYARNYREDGTIDDSYAPPAQRVRHVEEQPGQWQDPRDYRRPEAVTTEPVAPVAPTERGPSLQERLQGTMDKASNPPSVSDAKSAVDNQVSNVGDKASQVTSKVGDAKGVSDQATSQLKELKDLFDRGLIGDDVYKERQAQILNSALGK